jgi:hypothetical protein
MAAPLNILVASDFHYAGPAERQRHDFEARGIPKPFLRQIARIYRRFVWLHRPLEHYVQLDRLLHSAGQADLAVVNGDYSCDTGFVGISDDAAFASAQECLAKLRARFGAQLAATIGDHELGKLSLFGGVGGMRLASWERATKDLELRAIWELRLGRYVLIGVTSSLLALPVYECEALPGEMAGWRRLREEHLQAIKEVFRHLHADDRVLIFCHDPTALPFLGEVEAVQSRFAQIERTIIGHLHSPKVLTASQLLAGMPAIGFLGNTARRMTTALRRAQAWAPFKVCLCPSPSGCQLFKDGGFLTMQLDPTAQQPVQIKSHPLPWDGIK